MDNENKDQNMNDEQPPKWQPVQVDRDDNPQINSRLEQELEFEDLTKKIYARSVTGRFNNWRIALVFITQFVFYIIPWLNWGGRQAVLFDLASRKFYIFGMVLWPQDVFYLALILIISAYGLFLVTALGGRIFCGYACPQTVYTEIFMWVERKIEGDRSKRMRLDQEPRSFKRTRLKATKVSIWVLIAFWTGFTFIGWFSPIREAFIELLHFDLSIAQWVSMFVYGGYCFLAAGILRENVCRYMCPYARFQSVMVDADTVVVTYDEGRGEPRGKRSKKADPTELGLGDCIDCTMCVQVCPTGIDIRNGLQYLCIGCGACIDACDDVMDKMNYPRGLIRYTSENGIKENLDAQQVKKRLFLRPRVYVYFTLLVLFISAIVISLATRSNARIDVVRDRGSLGREIPGGLYENVYQIQLINMTDQERTFKVSAEASDLPDTKVRLESSHTDSINIKPYSNSWIPMVIQVPVEGSKTGLHDLILKVETVDDIGKLLKANSKSSFFVPE